VFFVGQKVTCINDRNWPAPRQFGAYSPILPARGRAYTVREVVPMMRRGWDEDGLFLEEIVNPIQTRRDGSTFELAFRQSRFRPLRATSIDLFLEMLQPVPTRERVRAERRVLVEEAADDAVRITMSLAPVFVGCRRPLIACRNHPGSRSGGSVGFAAPSKHPHGPMVRGPTGDRAVPASPAR
jgi:hypothetical protein